MHKTNKQNSSQIPTSNIVHQLVKRPQGHAYKQPRVTLQKKNNRMTGRLTNFAPGHLLPFLHCLYLWEHILITIYDIHCLWLLRWPLYLKFFKEQGHELSCVTNYSVWMFSLHANVRCLHGSSHHFFQSSCFLMPIPAK